MTGAEGLVAATVARFDRADGVGALSLPSGEEVRFGQTACREFVPEVGMRVWVVELAPHPLGGRKATRLHSEPISAAEHDARAQTRIEAARQGVSLEARAWLASHPEGYCAECMNVDAPRFVESLYAAGAEEVRVWVRGGYADQMQLALPGDATSRRALFEIINAQADAFGEAFAAAPDGRESRPITGEEAKTMGAPSAAGQPLEVDGPIADVGQSMLSLWWD